MNTPTDFIDWLETTSHLSPEAQLERFTKMHELEIKERALLLKHLLFDKDMVKQRLKNFTEEAFEQFELPAFYKSIDGIVDAVFAH